MFASYLRFREPIFGGASFRNEVHRLRHISKITVILRRILDKLSLRKTKYSSYHVGLTHDTVHHLTQQLISKVQRSVTARAVLQVHCSVQRPQALLPPPSPPLYGWNVIMNCTLLLAFYNIVGTQSLEWLSTGCCLCFNLVFKSVSLVD